MVVGLCTTKPFEFLTRKIIRFGIFFAACLRAKMGSATQPPYHLKFLVFLGLRLIVIFRIKPCRGATLPETTIDGEDCIRYWLSHNSN